MKKKFLNHLFLPSILTISIFGFTCSDRTALSEPEDNTIKDIDGNAYHIIKIGTQVWMAENLKVIHYRNGEAIPKVTDTDQWVSLGTGAYCNYDNDVNNAVIYGRLYNWYAVDDVRNIAPTGWHVPTDEEWKELEIALGMDQSTADFIGWRGTDEGGKLKERGTAHWWSPNSGATNASGFKALPGGDRSSTGLFYNAGGYGYWWSATAYNARPVFFSAWCRMLTYGSDQVGYGYYFKQGGFSVRCVRD